MADQDVATLFQHLAAPLAGLSTMVGTQGIAQVVHPFEGDSKKIQRLGKIHRKVCFINRVNR